MDKPDLGYTVGTSFFANVADMEERIIELGQQRDELLAALKYLYEDNVDYLTLNHLDGMNNQVMVMARDAIAKVEGRV